MFTLYRKYESPRDRPFEVCSLCKVFPPKIEIIVDDKRVELLCEWELMWLKYEWERQRITSIKKPKAV